MGAYKVGPKPNFQKINSLLYLQCNEISSSDKIEEIVSWIFKLSLFSKWWGGEAYILDAIL